MSTSLPAESTNRVDASSLDAVRPVPANTSLGVDRKERAFAGEGVASCWAGLTTGVSSAVKGSWCQTVRADIRRQTDSESGLVRKLGTVLFHAGLHAVLLYRLASWLCRHHLRPLAAVVGYVNASLTGAQISPRATVGKGLAIYHPYGIVIGATAVIGEGCTFVHGNVIGQLYGENDRPTIGNHFFAATGAKLLGNIRIGDHVHIAANAVVVRSMPDNVTVAAAPTRVVPRGGE